VINGVGKLNLWRGGQPRGLDQIFMSDFSSAQLSPELFERHCAQLRAARLVLGALKVHK
jgi:hypothetical protein